MNALVLEGSPHRIMAGWVNYQIIIRHNGGMKVSTCLGQAGSGERFAADLRGKFFPVGSWENGVSPDVKSLRELCLRTARLADSYDASRFASPRADVLDELFKVGGKP